MIRPPVVVVGSIAYDRIFDFPGRFRQAILPDKIHQLSVSFTVQDVQESFGGTAGNISYTLRLLGRPVIPIGSVGTDFSNYRAWLERSRIELAGIRRVPGKRTAAAYVITDRDDNQISAFQLGALSVPALAMSSIAKLLPTAIYGIIAPGNPRDMLLASRQFSRLKVPYLFDPGQSLPILSSQDIRAMLDRADGLISNDYELELLCRRARVKPRALASQVRYVVTTLGPRGSVVQQGSSRVRIPAAKPRTVVDPTGAGDAYRAGLVAALVRGQSLVTAAKMGAVASVYTVELPGTQTHRFTVADFARRYRATFGTSSPP
ncbi:MAG: carbohydrate kinase family protein [Candidatus Kerfeldbacteria bacterium]|nr:carbohydrate kinase family protein [Candidatus Kerfeldbacteria bacterium]